MSQRFPARFPAMLIVDSFRIPATDCETQGSIKLPSLSVRKGRRKPDGIDAIDARRNPRSICYRRVRYLTAALLWIRRDRISRVQGGQRLQRTEEPRRTIRRKRTHWLRHVRTFGNKNPAVVDVSRSLHFSPASKLPRPQ